MPHLPKLKTLWVFNNKISEEASTRLTLANKCPLLEDLRTHENPCNPKGSDKAAYKLYRARFAIYLPYLKQLDN